MTKLPIGIMFRAAISAGQITEGDLCRVMEYSYYSPCDLFVERIGHEGERLAWRSINACSSVNCPECSQPMFVIDDYICDECRCLTSHDL